MRKSPPPLELQCLKALWRLGESNVGAVREALRPTRELAYTTILTVLDRLARKGSVERRKVGRQFVYAPLVSREAVRRVAVRELVDCYFGGSEEELLAFLRRPERERNGHVREPELDPTLL